MRQIAGLVHTWSAYHPQRRRNLNAYFVQAARGEPGAIVDPVPLLEGDEAHLRDLGGVAAIVVTQRDRLTEAERLSGTVRCPVVGPAGLAGADLPGGLRLVVANDETDKADGVVVLMHGPSGSVLVGQPVVGAPAGDLTIETPAGAAGGAGEDQSAQAAQVAHRLRAVLSDRVSRVLVAEGEPVVRDAERVLQDLIFAHDPAWFLLHAEELVWQPPRERGSRFSRRSAECSRLVGLRTLDFEVTTVSPGKQSTLLHGHPGLEELFIVLEGEGEAQTERGSFVIGKGDVLGFPARHHVAHAIRNTGRSELRFLSFGAPPPTDERAGIADYPESNKQLQWIGPGRSRLFYLPEKLDVDYWESERLD